MLQKRLLRDVGRAIADFRLVEPGDRILVGVSGGKDSFTLLHLLQHLQRSAPIEFSLICIAQLFVFHGIERFAPKKADKLSPELLVVRTRSCYGAAHSAAGAGTQIGMALVELIPKLVHLTGPSVSLATLTCGSVSLTEPRSPMYPSR